MQRRILVWRSVRPELTPEIIRELRELAAVSTWESWWVGPHAGSPERSWDGALVIDVATRQALDEFDADPRHLEVIGRIRPHLAEIAKVDLDLADAAISGAPS